MNNLTHIPNPTNAPFRSQEEKEQNRLLAGDLELTQRNMKKTLDQLKEQLAINERLMGVIKVTIAALLCFLVCVV